ncbi:hypothetical protein K2X89_04325, partial [Myxococcota bacterium]|nr:hypothetical protein [Myxococcota bacterium]
MANGRPILILKTGEALPPVREACGDFEHWIARGLGRALEPRHVEVAAVYQGDPLPAPDRIGGVAGRDMRVVALDADIGEQRG